MMLPKYYIGFEQINKIGKTYKIKSYVIFENIGHEYVGTDKPFILLKILNQDCIKIFCEGKIMYFTSFHFHSTEHTLEIEELG